MNRPILLYIGMHVLLIGGFEGIRRIGNTLTPPPNIAGRWQVTVPPVPSSCPLLELTTAPNPQLQIEQSGRYLTLVFPDVHRTRLRARFHHGTLQGHGVSGTPCAAGAELGITGHLRDRELTIAVAPASGAENSAVFPLVIYAKRALEAEVRPLRSSQH